MSETPWRGPSAIPSLTLAFWLPEFGRYVDLDGRPVEPTAGSGRASTPIDRDGTHVAILEHDAALRDEPELLAAVAAGAGLALDNARLQAELRARVEELRGSRARILEAGQLERQRLERNLHDGAQQRLIALSLELGLLEESIDIDSETRGRIDRAREEISASLEELRDVARGLHPAVVSGHGLAVALESLTARAPVPVRLKVTVEDRLPEGIEIAAYYVVSESLANVARHAHASGASVEVSRAGWASRDRGHRRRDRGRRHRVGLGAAWFGRPCRGARRAASDVESSRRRHPVESGDPMRVMIAEDSVLLREGLSRLLAENGMEVVASCMDADELLRGVRVFQPDVAIVDIRLPPTYNDEGLRAAIEIRADYPSVGVLVLSQYVEVGLAMKLLANSAEGTGYLLKDRISDVKEFISAVRRVAGRLMQSTR